MIEGLRALPSLQHARKEAGQTDLLDCTTCMEQTTHEMRRTMRCGLLPASEHRPGMRWQPEGDELTVCAGYSTSLPEVVDAASCLVVAESVPLRDRCGNRIPPPALIDAVTLLKGAVNQQQARLLDKKGGS